MVDIARYLSHIGLCNSKKRAPNLATLEELHRAHPQAIPFESISPFIGEDVPIDLDSIQAKMLVKGRGGYCFEHNKLFRCALEALGFDVKTMMARVLWAQNEHFHIGPCTHMFLLVTIEGYEYIADVGFGGMTLSGPILFRLYEEQQLPLGRFRLNDTKAFPDLQNIPYVLETKLGETWKPMYCFDKTVCYDCDLDVSNYYVSTHPDSIFRRSFMVAQHGPDYMLTIANCRLKVYHQNGEIETISHHPESIVSFIESRLRLSPDTRRRLEHYVKQAFK